ncbi:hypothetical protein GCM10009864_45240 [Streptomyces lunalinharesii]|uniref:FHA domain-containing protein n=1 Tax=Streptomyces lunalinharesii TaxID=333384 RepID=A0ABN3S7N3_9ACTN
MLEGSQDGTTRTPPDTRSGRSVARDRRTRVFSIGSPVSHRHYRIVSGEKVVRAETALVTAPPK